MAKQFGNKADGQGGSASSSEGWIDQELAGCEFQDERLTKRFEKLFRQLSGGIGESIPWACQDWANTKAAYRFLANERVSEAAILGGHFQATEKRLASGAWPILMLHDTTELSFHRKDVAAVGMTTRMPTRKLDGKPQHYNVCGILMHSSLAVTLNGLPLGLTAIKFWSRDKFYGCNQMKKRINPTRIPIEQKESYRWLENVRQSTALLPEPCRCVHIGDRESDIYELFCTAQAIGTHFLLRTCVDRLAGDGKHTIATEMAEVRVQGLHRIEVRDKKGNASEAVLEIRYRRIRVFPPINKSKQYPELLLTVIHAQERGAPIGRDRVDWKLITDLPVTSRKEAIEKLRWYSLRWKIEVFHKILKSGCKAEASKLRTASRLVNLISVLVILSWRISWMTMMNRAAPDSGPEVAFTALEIKLLDRLVSDKRRAKVRNRSLSAYLTKLARLGGYLARSSDPPPGNMVVWRGLSRLTDIHLGFLLATHDVGN
jgi:hypothetical protein